MENLDDMLMVKREMIDLGKKAVDLQYVTTIGGNMSFRLSEDRFLITMSGVPLDELTEENILLINACGEPIDESQQCLKPSKETPMHLAILQERPDVRAVVHFHPIISTTLASIDEPILPVTTEERLFIGERVGIVPLLKAGSSELHEAVIDAVRGLNLVILKHHGCVALGSSLKEAFYRVVKLERAAYATVLARIFDKKIPAFPFLG